MEYVVFLIGLGLFVAYRHWGLLFASIVAFAAAGAALPRIAIVDWIGSNGWVQGGYMLTVVILFYAGIAGVMQNKKPSA